ncbi:MAG: polysaccharide biosynthesis tyrosine autokinase [Flavobacteriales bacterium]|nr:polysaccharide biosynthesis tyrosine autokinase [Flavobacteriales bacterium]
MLNDTVGDQAASLDSYRDRITNFSNEFDLGLFIYIVKRSLVWIAMCLLLAMGAAYIYLRYTAPTYASSATLQMGQSNKAQTVLKVSDMMDDNSLQADVQLLRSKFFIAKAVQALPLRVRYFFRGQILTEEHYRQSFFTVDRLNITNAAVEGRPINVQVMDDNSLRLDYVIGAAKFQIPVEPNVPFSTPHFSAVITSGSSRPWPKGLEDNTLYFTLNSNQALTNQLATELTVSIAELQANTVLIACKDHNAMLARDLCQAMADAYIKYDLERRSESAESILRFIEAQKDTVFAELRDSEMKMEIFKRDNRVANMEDLTPLLVKRSDEYEDDVLKLRMEDNLLREIEHAAKRDEGHMDVYHLLPLMVGTPFAITLDKALSTLGDLLKEREEMAFDATAEYVTLQGLDVHIERQQDLILESIATMRERNASKMRDYEQKMNEYDRRFAEIPEQELAYGRIERLFNINEKYYTQLLEKDIEYRISKAGFVPENRVLESAVLPTSPISPDRGVVLLSYFLTGLILGVLIVLVRYILHDNITSLNDIANASNASVGILGMVPKYKKEIPVSQLLVDKNPKSLIAESFRTVRTNLQFVDNTPGAKTIAITSTISGEGKTFVAINLAGIISFSESRVVILDLDMRKPKIHLGFGVENIRGMSTLLIGKDTLDNCIQKSSLPDLDFITAGPIPPNPSELIISEAMPKILEQLKERYDVVLIDTPPVGLVTDGISIIQSASIPIYIFRADYSKKVFVQNVDRLINENHIKKLCAVLNGVDVDRNKYGYAYGYGYGYGYGAGYGYGYYEDKAKGLAKQGFLKKLFGKA